VISTLKSSWRSVTNGAPQGSIPGPILFNIINDLDNGTEYTLSKFADNRKVRGVVDAPDGCTALQRDLDRLEKWVGSNFMKYYEGKCKVVYHRRNNSMHQYGLGANQLVYSVLAKDPGGH